MDDEITIQELSRIIKARLNIEHDLVIAMTGDEGYGKSSLAIQLSKEFDPNFNLLRNVSYLPTKDEMADKFNNLQTKQAFIVDEAIKVLYKLKWQDRLQQLINEMYATERWQSKLTILCIPRYRDLNEQFRHHRVMVWIHVIDRGIAFIFVKDRMNFVAEDPWYLSEIEKAIKEKRKYSKHMDADVLAGLLRRFDNYNGFILFEQLDIETENQYKAYKTSFREKEAELARVAKEDSNKFKKHRNTLIAFALENLFKKEVLNGEDVFNPLKEIDLANVLDMTQQAINAAKKEAKEARA